MCWPNDNNRLRYEILYDAIVNPKLTGKNCTAVVPAVAGNYTYTRQRQDIYEFTTNLNHRVSYSGTTNGIADITSGALIIMLWGSPTGGCQADISWKIWYEDM